MTTPLALVPVQQETRAPAPFTPEQVQLIKDTIARDQQLTDNELQLFLYVAQRRGLDPLVKQIYAIRRKGKITHQTSIDGFRLIAARTGAYCGRDRAVYEGEVDLGSGRTVPAVCLVTVYREVNGMPRGWTAEARWDEYYPGPGTDGFMWRSKPYLMLAKCAEAQALRAAFPEELGGLYTGDEMAQAGRPDTIQGVQAQDETTGGETPDDAEVATLVLEGAETMVLPGVPGKAWGGKAGQTLGSLKSKLLARILDWCRDKMDERGPDPDPTLGLLAMACSMILEARAAGTRTEPEDVKATPQPAAPAPREPGEEDA